MLFVPDVQGQFDVAIICFSPCSGTSGSFAANRIRLNTNASGIETDSELGTEALIYIKFPSGDVSAVTHLCVDTDRLETKQHHLPRIFFAPCEDTVSGRQKPSNVSLGFVLYQNDNFFRSMRYRRERATVRVLAGQVRDGEQGLVPQHVEIRFRRMVRKTISCSLDGISRPFMSVNHKDVFR